jgi:alkyl hydroperoxide reductase subunit AhpC
MATLVLPQLDGLDSPRRTRGTSLRAWLNDGWALLFSHPDDFVRCEMEQDRWLTIARWTFAQQRVQPLALARPAQPLDAGWVTQSSGDAGIVLLEDTAELFALHARRLREAIQAAGSRFVMIVDSMLVRRRTFSYSDIARLPSPLDFVAWIKTLDASDGLTAQAAHCPVQCLHPGHAPAATTPPARIAWLTA